MEYRNYSQDSKSLVSYEKWNLENMLKYVEFFSKPILQLEGRWGMGPLLNVNLAAVKFHLLLVFPT